MDNTTKKQLRELVTKGFKQRYGTHPDKQALLRLLCELRRIDMTGYAGYYLMAYRIFCEFVGLWAYEWRFNATIAHLKRHK